MFQKNFTMQSSIFFYMKNYYKISHVKIVMRY